VGSELDGAVYDDFGVVPHRFCWQGLRLAWIASPGHTPARMVRAVVCYDAVADDILLKCSLEMLMATIINICALTGLLQLAAYT
jgi:hypothetical protein